MKSRIAFTPKICDWNSRVFICGTKVKKDMLSRRWESVLVEEEKLLQERGEATSVRSRALTFLEFLSDRCSRHLVTGSSESSQLLPLEVSSSWLPWSSWISRIWRTWHSPRNHFLRRHLILLLLPKYDALLQSPLLFNAWLQEWTRPTDEPGKLWMWYVFTWRLCEVPFHSIGAFVWESHKFVRSIDNELEYACGALCMRDKQACCVVRVRAWILCSSSLLFVPHHAYE